MSRGRVAVGLATAAVLLLGISGLSRVPMSGARETEAVLRLSWRTTGLRVEECRRRTEQELATLAEHMRTPEVCVGRGADYELRVNVDGAVVVRDTIVPSGARHDRPVYVFEDLALGPGRYRVEVEFTALVPPGYEVEDAQIRYSWGGEVRLEPREIGLITLDPSGRALVGMEP